MSSVYRSSICALIAGALLASCGGGGGGSVSPPGGGGGGAPTPTPSAAPTPTPTSVPTPTPTPVPTPTATPTPSPSASPAQPQVINMGFDLMEHTDAQFGPVYYYSTMLNGMAEVVRVAHGSKVVFLNDDPSMTQHTAAGFGTSGFPASFDNSNRFTQHGTTIDSSLTWSTGTLNPGQKSQVFSVGPPGNYYFGCGFHYFGVPTASFASMGDVLVSM